MTNSWPLLLLTCIVTGCGRKTVTVPPTPSNMARQDDYVDLAPDWKLRVVVPLVKSGGFRPVVSGEQTNGNTITMSAMDLAGYEVSQYAVTGKSASRVRIVFVSAESTREGKTVPEKRPPALPFSFPHGSEYIRLVYLVRVSQADHNMAIVAAKRVEALDAFTKRLKEDPVICGIEEGVFCSWVPAGVAVRPDKP
jgi:hypothetical protein